MEDIYCEVDFFTFCEKCKYGNLKEWRDPCNACIEEGMREETVKPLYFEEADTSELNKRKKEKKNGTG